MRPRTAVVAAVMGPLGFVVGHYFVLWTPTWVQVLALAALCLVVGWLWRDLRDAR